MIRKRELTGRWRMKATLEGASGVYILLLLHFIKLSASEFPFLRISTTSTMFASAVKIHPSKLRREGKGEKAKAHYSRNKHRGRRRQNQSNEQNTKKGFFEDPIVVVESERHEDSFFSTASEFFRPVRTAFVRITDDASILLKEVRPVRDALDGVVEAIPLVWKGYYLGFESLLNCSLTGLTENGLGGLVLGATDGSLRLLSMTVVGLLAGAYQGVKGIHVVPESIRAMKEGKTWDKRLREWFFYSLDAEEQLLVSERENNETDHGHPRTEGKTSRVRKKRSLRKNVKDSTFYDIFNIPVDANNTEIKKAYYQLALTLHPDKNDELSATERFAQINKIYRILINEELRAIYDQSGSCYLDRVTADTELTSDAQVNPYRFFSDLFESNGMGFELYVGEDLAIATLVDNILGLTDRADSRFQSPTKKFWYESPQQRTRQVKIASHLRLRIDNYVKSDFGLVSFEKFEESCRYEAEALVAALDVVNNARSLLNGVATGIISETMKYLVPPWIKPLLKNFFVTRDTVHHFHTNHNLSRMAQKAMVKYYRHSVVKVEGTLDGCGDEDKAEDLNTLLKAFSSPKMWKVLQEFNANDVHKTLREATKRVLDDCGSDYTNRLKKAKALNTLGRIFYDVANNYEKERVPRDDFDARILQRMVKNALLQSVENEK